MSNGGFILLHRSIQDHWTYQERPFSELGALIDLMLHASFKDRDVSLRGELYKVKRGDVLWSQRNLSKRWGWSEKRVRGFLGRLQKTGTIRVETIPHRVTRITFVNYSYYQNGGRTTGGTDDEIGDAVRADESRRTNKDNKLPKNGKCQPPLVDEVKAYFSEKEYPSTEAGKFFSHYEACGWRMGTSAIVNWKAAADKWVLNGKGGSNSQSASSKSNYSLKKCRKCGHEWAWKQSGITVCPVCYPELRKQGFDDSSANGDRGEDT